MDWYWREDSSLFWARSHHSTLVRHCIAPAIAHMWYVLRLVWFRNRFNLVWRKLAAQQEDRRFVSFLSSGFITAVVVNHPERKLAKHTSVQWLKYIAKGLCCANPHQSINICIDSLFMGILHHPRRYSIQKAKSVNKNAKFLPSEADFENKEF